MIRRSEEGDDTDAASLADRLATFIREQAPVAYCDQCLALRFGATFATVRASLLLLAKDPAFSRRLRHCYRCGSTVELTSLG